MIKEKRLIQMLKDRDKQSMSLLYDQYSAALFGVALRIVKSEALAEDVLQDAFLKIWKSGASYDSKRGTLFTWMLNITRNTAIDKTRSQHFRASGKIQSLDTFVNGSERGSTEEVPIEHIGVRDEVKKLDEKYRQIIDLVYFNGYTQQEISDELGIPLGTVKTRVKIALRELRKIFVETKRALPLLLLLFSYSL